MREEGLHSHLKARFRGFLAAKLAQTEPDSPALSAREPLRCRTIIHWLLFQGHRRPGGSGLDANTTAQVTIHFSSSVFFRISSRPGSLHSHNQPAKQALSVPGGAGPLDEPKHPHPPTARAPRRTKTRHFPMEETFLCESQLDS